MRMNLFDKFLLALVLLAVLAVALFLGLLAASVISLNVVTNFLEAMGGRMWSINAWILGGIALVIFIVVVRLLAASYGGRGTAYTRLSVTENGEIAISIPTIKQIAAAFMANKPEIAASASDVLPTKLGLFMRIRVCIKEGSVIPEVTDAVQKELKAHLETVTGLVIKQVRLDVDNDRSHYSGKGR